MSQRCVTNISPLKCLSCKIFQVHDLGNVQRDLKLNFEKDTSVRYSCGASLNGQYWIIGGENKKRQVCHLQENRTIKMFI